MVPKYFKKYLFRIVFKMNSCINIYKVSILFLLATICLSKPAVDILPLNPHDPEKLPEGVTKNILVIGNIDLNKFC